MTFPYKSTGEPVPAIVLTGGYLSTAGKGTEFPGQLTYIALDYVCSFPVISKAERIFSIEALWELCERVAALYRRV
jgi:hypothetical protein